MVSHETMKFCKFSFSSSHCVKWQFLHFHTILVVFYKVFIIITDIFGLFFAVVYPLFRNREISFTVFTPWPLWKIIINLMCSRHKLCIQWKAVLVWALLYSVLSLQTLLTFRIDYWPYESAKNGVFNEETGWDIIGKKSVIRNVLHLDRKNNT